MCVPHMDVGRVEPGAEPGTGGQHLHKGRADAANKQPTDLLLPGLGPHLWPTQCGFRPGAAWLTPSLGE